MGSVAIFLNSGVFYSDRGRIEDPYLLYRDNWLNFSEGMSEKMENALGCMVKTAIKNH